MKTKFYSVLPFLLIALFFMFDQSAISQTNIAPSASVSHSGGGSGAFGPAEYNNSSISTCPSLPWGWTSGGGTITFTWGSTQSFSGVQFFKGDRPMTSCNIQVFSGGSWTTIASSIGGGSCDVTYNFSASGTGLRFTNVLGSNPNFREIEIYACSCQPSCSFSNPSTSPAGVLNVWTGEGTSDGAYPGDWNRADNWSRNEVPTTSHNVIIPYCSAKQPVIYGSGSGTMAAAQYSPWPKAYCNTITIYSDDNAELTFNSSTALLDVTGSF